MTSTFLSILLTYRYVALFPLAAIEGPAVALVAGYLIHLGYLAIIPAYIILIFGDIIPDSIYYLIGKKGNKKRIVEKYSPRLRIIAGSFNLLDHLWEHHPQKTMFFSKLAYGLSIPFIISAGISQMSYKKFLQCILPPTLFQYGLLMIVGYSLGKSFDIFTKYIRYGGIGVACTFVIFIVCYSLFLNYAKKTIINLEQSEQ